MRNTLPALSASRQPRGIVKVDGTAVPGWVSWEVNNNSFYQADTFRVTFALSGLPPQFDAAWWAAQTTVSIEIFAGFPGDPANVQATDLESLIYGNADEITFDPAVATIEVTGRDLTALLIDTKTTEKFQNLTSSQIATQLAQRHGLTPVVTATTTLAGKFYEIDHAQMNSQRSEWELLTFLAGAEQFVVYVKGQELHFEPKPDVATVDPYVLKWEPPSNGGAPAFNGTKISFSRNLTVAKGVIVIVRSWNAKQKKGFTSYYPKAAANFLAGSASITTPGASGPKGGAQVYTFIVPGLSQQKADEMAANKHREITRHEMKLEATMPADNLLAVTDIIQVTGTGTAFDQQYFPDSITRRMSVAEGYAMAVSAKNHNPDSETLA